MKDSWVSKVVAANLQPSRSRRSLDVPTPAGAPTASAAPASAPIGSGFSSPASLAGSSNNSPVGRATSSTSLPTQGTHSDDRYRRRDGKRRDAKRERHCGPLEGCPCSHLPARARTGRTARARDVAVLERRWQEFLASELEEVWAARTRAYSSASSPTPGCRHPALQDKFAKLDRVVDQFNQLYVGRSGEPARCVHRWPCRPGLLETTLTQRSECRPRGRWNATDSAISSDFSLPWPSASSAWSTDAPAPRRPHTPRPPWPSSMAWPCRT